jgi:hypothetical protein
MARPETTNPLDLTSRTVRLHGLLDMATDAFGVEAGSPDFGEGLAKLAGLDTEEDYRVGVDAREVYDAPAPEGWNQILNNPLNL